MAGFIAQGNDIYVGTFTNAENDGVLENGMFAVPNYATGTASQADTTSGDGEVYFVENEITTITEEGIDDVDFTIKNGDFLRLNKAVEGQIYVTTNYDGSPTVGDELAVGANGSLEAISTRTPKYKFIVKEVTTAYGTDAIKVSTVLA